VNVAGPPAVGNNQFVIGGNVASPSNISKSVYGLISSAGDPLLFSLTGGLTIAAATACLVKIPLPGSGTTTYSITNVLCHLQTKATSTLTHSFAGLLTSAGVLIGMTADNSSINANWSSTGTSPAVSTMALVGGPFTVTPTGIDDFVYGALYVGTTAGTAPKFAADQAGTVASLSNLSLSAATSRFATQAVVDTATPFAALTMSSNTAAATTFWMGIS
jgi:hypothetical protein